MRMKVSWLWILHGGPAFSQLCSKQNALDSLQPREPRRSAPSKRILRAIRTDTTPRLHFADHFGDEIVMRGSSNPVVANPDCLLHLVQTCRFHGMKKKTSSSVRLADGKMSKRSLTHGICLTLPAIVALGRHRKQTVRRLRCVAMHVYIIYATPAQPSSYLHPP
jgi:hypothetical protein